MEANEICRWYHKERAKMGIVKNEGEIEAEGVKEGRHIGDVLK